MAATTTCFNRAPLRLRLRLLFLSAVVAALAVLSSERVAFGHAESVGDPERRELAAAAGSGGSGGGGGACPNVTTLAAATTTAARITSGGSGCRSETLAATKEGDRVALDARSRGVTALASVPADVQLLTLRNNSIRSLDAVAFPKALLTLDVSSNALTTLANVSFPASLTLLNVSRNPIASLSAAQLPARLVQLDATRAGLTALMNLSFPDSLERLNLSGNAIARIAGVTFPASLAQLSIDALAPAADDSVAAPAALSQKSALKEFEVRQTDAALFAKLEIASFDVAATTTRVTCSDTRAKPVYVRDTMLCVLPDDVFAAKYGDASTSNGGATNGGGGGSDRTPREKVDESFGQSRSWFLLVSALALGGFVACLFGVALCRVCGRRLGVRGATADTTSKAQHAHQQRELLVRDQDGRRNGADDDGDDDEPDTRAVV